MNLDTTPPDQSAAAEGRWRFLRRTGWVAVCLCASVLLQSLFHQPLGPILPAGVIGLVVIAGFRPYYGLLLLAAFGPLSNALFHLGSSSTLNVQFAEALTLAFITGWAAGRAFAPAPLAVSPATRWAAVLLLAAAAASGVTQWTAIRMEALAEPLAEVVQRFITRDYLLHLHGSAPITAAALLCEGAILLLIAADVCARAQARRDSVLGAMVIGAAAAGCLNLLRVVTASMAQENAWTAFLHYVRMLRVNVQFADLNAAGSYFALMLPMGLGLLARRPVFAAVCIPPIAAALWISGSRFALGGAFAGMGLGALLALRRRSRRVVSAVAGLVLIGVLAGAVWKFYPENRNSASSVALNVRVGLAKIGWDMAARHPVFGVGLGSYYVESESYLRSTPIDGVGERENAHNYFIQILAELGVSGLVVFLAALAAPVRVLWRSQRPSPVMSVGLLAGLVAFLLSCLGGHPLMIPEASYPFWIALGLAAAPLGEAAAGQQVARRTLRVAAGAALMLFAVTLPFRMAESARTADMSNVSIGLSPHWQHDPDGTRFRWASGRSAFYVSPQARATRIALRNSDVAGRPLEVRVFLNGREADRLMLPADGRWRVLRLILRNESAFSRVDLLAGLMGSAVPLDVSATDRHGIMQVGRPTIEE